MQDPAQKSTHIKYDNHQSEWEACINDDERKQVARTWIEQRNTVDIWRHNRMYTLVKPVIDFDRDATWLTVGDGRYGTDAHALIKMGAKNVHCTDISDTLLKIGNAQGFIGDYSAQNAESLQFQDNQFEFVLCKEALHHFPRPYNALHEMFRVAKKAVVIIEPRDHSIDRGNFYGVLKAIKYILKRNRNAHDFEPVGNYVYSVSERELEKFILGMHERFIAFNGINDVYEKGAEFVELSTADQTQRRLVKRIQFKIKMADAMGSLGLRKSGLIVAMLFKSEPHDQLKALLSGSGWEFKALPKNPYL